MIAHKEIHFLFATSNWINFPIVGQSILSISRSSVRSKPFFIPRNRSASRYTVARVSESDQEILCGKGIVSPKLRIHRARRGHVGARGRCKLGGNISAVKYLSRLTRHRGGSYHSIGVRTWHEIYYARYIAILSTSVVEYVTLRTTMTVMQIDPLSP